MPDLALDSTIGEIDRRRTAGKNLLIAFPGSPASERARILRLSFANIGRTFVEFIRFLSLSPARLADAGRNEPQPQGAEDAA